MTYYAFLFSLTILGYSLSLNAREPVRPTFDKVETESDLFGITGRLSLHVTVPGDSLITLQATDSLSARSWVDVSTPVLSLNPGRMVLPADAELGGRGPANSLFFRLKVDTYSSLIQDDGRTIRVTTETGTPAALLFQTLSRRLGRDIFFSNLVDNLTILPARTWEAKVAEDLFKNESFQVWVTPPMNDDPRYAARLALADTRQTGLVTATGGAPGKMEDGPPINTQLPGPVAGAANPPLPGPRAPKTYNLQVPSRDGALQEKSQAAIPGRHFRLKLRVLSTGSVTPVQAFSSSGNALLATPPTTPALGSLIWVVQSPKSASREPLNIYHIGVLDNPFVIRAYNPPFRGSHGTFVTDEAEVQIPIPVLDADRDLAGLVVKIYRYTQPAYFDFLTPTVFAQNIQSFQLLGELQGAELVRLQTRPPALANEGDAPAMRSSASKAPTVTQLHASGPRATKFNMVIIGDGFADTTADQNLYNNYIDQVIMKDLLAQDVHPEILNAINIFRINTFSTESGITTIDVKNKVLTKRNTALDYGFSADWNNCWMTPGPNTTALIDAAVNALVPEANVKAVILNTPGFGGCSRGHHFAVTRGVDWTVFAHEFGHFVGGLADEYQCASGASGCGTYSGVELPEVNQTMVTTRNEIKWNEWIPATRPVPTSLANVADISDDAGLFPGSTRSQSQWWNGIYRPSVDGRMNNNDPIHNPVGYSTMREGARARQDGDFRKSAAGDYDGDGKTDLVVLDDRQLSLYLARDRTVTPNDPVLQAPLRSVTGILKPTWYHTDILYNSNNTRSWEFRGSDILIPADFDGDGKDDLYVINLADWIKPYLVLLQSTGTGFTPVRRYDLQLPGWDDMRQHDEFYAADFNGDGKKDLLVYNGQDWDIPFFLLLRSTGTSLEPTRRYDRYLPGWEMGRHEKFFVGDYNGDGRQEVISQNVVDWSQVHLMVFTSTGTELALADRHYGRIGRNLWAMNRQDRIIPIRFNSDKRTDVALFNGLDWLIQYLGIFHCDADAKLVWRRQYSDGVPGWDMAPHDRFWAANVDGDGDEDLVVFNGDDWTTSYLGMFRSDGDTSVSATWQNEWIGSWHMGPVDSFHVADFRGGGGWADLFVYNKNWFGLLRSMSSQYQLEAIYPKWIHQHRFHQYGWW